MKKNLQILLFLTIFVSSCTFTPQIKQAVVTVSSTSTPIPPPTHPPLPSPTPIPLCYETFIDRKEESHIKTDQTLVLTHYMP